MSNTNNIKKQLQWEVSFKRNGDFPLDRSSIFETYDEAMNYVNGSDTRKGVPYLGQVITILTNTNETSYDESGVYVIKELPNEGNELNGRIERAGEIIGGDAISVADGNQIDIVLNDDVKNFITKNDKGLAVTSIDANKTTTSKEIQILGGPLANDANDVFSGGVIPSGTSIEDILTKLLCKEIYNTTSPTLGSCTFASSKPNLTSSNTTKGSLVEVGTTITFDTITAKNVTATITDPKVGRFTNGYRTELTGETIETSDGYVRTSWTTGQTNGSYYKLELTKTGFTGNLPSTVTATTYDNCEISSFNLTTIEGENTLKVTETPAKHDRRHSGIPSYYIVSNMGNVDSRYMSNEVASVNDTSVPVNQQNNTFSVTGVYPIFTNGVSYTTNKDEVDAENDLLDNPVSDDGTKLGLVTSNTLFAVSFAHQDIAPYRLLVPDGWKINEAIAFDSLVGDYKIGCIDKFSSKGTTTKKIQGVDVSYTIYEWNESKGPNFVTFKVGE